MTSATHPSPTLFLVPRQRIEELAWEPLPGSSGVSHRAVYIGEGVVAGQLRFRPGAEEASHLHDHGEHHLFVVEGCVVVDETVLPAGSYLHVPSHLLHTIADAGLGSTLLYVHVSADGASSG